MKRITNTIIVSIIGISSMAFVPVVFADTTDFVPSLGPTSDTVVTVPTITATDAPEVGTTIIPTTTGSILPEAGVTLVPTSTVSTLPEGGTTLIPSGNGSNAPEGGTTLIPTGIGSNAPEGGTTLIPTLGGQNGPEGIVTTSTTTTPDNGSGSNNSSGGSGGSFSSSGSSGGSTLLSNVAGVSAVNLNTCPLLTSFMQIGGDNKTDQVFKLQAFLKNVENIDVNFTGVFDTKTESAVKAFQKIYLSDVMGPWKSNSPSGIVYITTKKKINEIACQSSLVLSADELATITTYLANLQNNGSTIVGPTNETGTSTSTTSPLIGENVSNTTNTASVINANILQRFWSFLKNIF